MKTLISELEVLIAAKITVNGVEIEIETIHRKDLLKILTRARTRCEGQQTGIVEDLKDLLISGQTHRQTNKYFRRALSTLIHRYSRKEQCPIPAPKDGLREKLKKAFNKHRLPPSEMGDRYNIGWDDCQSYIENIVEEHNGKTY